MLITVIILVRKYTGQFVVFGVEVSWALSKCITCSALNTIFDRQQARQTFIGKSRLYAILLTAQRCHLSPVPACQSGHFLSYFCPFSSPSFPSALFSFPLNHCHPYHIWYHFLAQPLFSPFTAFRPLCVQSTDKLNKSPCNWRNTSHWQCSITWAAYLLTEWINVLHSVWETTCSGTEGYSQAHRSAG